MTANHDGAAVTAAQPKPFRVTLVRDVVVAQGADARSYLHSQLSNDIASLAVGSSCYSFVLEPTGKLSAFVRVRCIADDHFVLDTDEGAGESLLARINRFKIRVKCDTVLMRQNMVALRCLRDVDRVGALALPGAVAAWRQGDGAVDVFGDTASIDPLIDQLIDPLIDPVNIDAYHIERLRRAWPIFGVDIGPDSIPAETSLVDVCVSFTKGCYPGQELVERMDSRGSSAPRRLMCLPASGTTGPNEPYRIGDIEVGRCTSLAGEFALVMVMRSHLATAEALAVS